MKRRNPIYVVGRILVIPIFKLLFFYKVNGKKNLPKTGPFIVCSNHLSNYDPVFLALTQKRQIYYMAKAELFKNKFLSWLIRTLGAFPVERGAGDGKAINQAEEVVNDGRLLGIFIEGTRSKTGEFLRPKSGAAIIAHQMNVPVIPVCITPKNKKVKVFQKVTISWGKPMSVEELGLKNGGGEEYRNASRKIMDEIKKLRENDLK
ncbi:MAG: 1-acyl-sn-glycerol-3-phosphate acyltransferase [Clostridia bacterium]|nr:1-acyl-sn-glycerol-3-phosphate acyltransferase [Clostridia bacterium]